MIRYVVDASGYHITAAQFAADRQIEEREVAFAAFDLRLGSD